MSLTNLSHHVNESFHNARNHGCSGENIVVRYFKRESVTLHMKESCHMEMRHITYECIMWMPVVRSESSHEGMSHIPFECVVSHANESYYEYDTSTSLSQWMNYTTWCIGHNSDSMTCFVCRSKKSAAHEIILMSCLIKCIWINHIVVMFHISESCRWASLWSFWHTHFILISWLIKCILCMNASCYMCMHHVSYELIMSAPCFACDSNEMWHHCNTLQHTATHCNTLQQHTLSFLIQSHMSHMKHGADIIDSHETEDSWIRHSWHDEFVMSTASWLGFTSQVNLMLHMNAVDWMCSKN